MKYRALLVFFSAVTIVLSPIVGGAAMSPAKNIVQNITHSKDHTTLATLIKQAGLTQRLSGPGPFTIFAPTNEAFATLPQAVAHKLMSNKKFLTKVLLYHAVAGRLDAKSLMAKIQAEHGRTVLKTLEGKPLIVSMMGDELMLTDAKNTMSMVSIADLYQSNGVIHVVDSVLRP